ncbi:tetratricopeptide repeat protein 1 [Eucyclogobius newberryi]|uniref:tetratricopeptide repeat protein 1 n=1 Tax=Eucyclogobius newberryi TaxID=166745 RepID=UPI003B5B8333
MENKTEKQDEEENFYDCQESLETSGVLQRLNLKEETRREEMREETTRKETTREETTREETTREETTREEMREETMREEMRREETMREETMREETMREETRREETMREETMREETRREETMREETMREEMRRLQQQFKERLKASDPEGGDEERTRGCTEEGACLAEDGACLAEEGAGLAEEGAGLAGDQEAEFPPEQVQDDEQHLMELEKELSDDEKEIRRQQSLSLKHRGNQLFKSQKWSSAESVYSEALTLCPLSFSTDRAVLFSNRGAARVHLGEKDKAIADCSKAVELNPEYIKALLRRAELYEQTDKLDEALDDYKKILERDPHNSTARGGAVRLPPLIHERNEKLKEEMMGKLKDLGNMILRPFGLSTNNFQLNQDQSTGSYNVNFVQNPNNNNR